ncbi:TPA: MerR family transcriptional regulator, partial [Enterococcus faecium]|nr:MerR family transcriptional regulator [Enterococcus faecium]
PPVNRTKGGIRDYTEEDLKWVDFTICMRNAGLSIESLIEYIRLSSEGEATVFERRKLLIEESELLTKEIAEMQECLERLQGKIKKYDRVLSRNKMECIK